MIERDVIEEKLIIPGIIILDEVISGLLLLSLLLLTMPGVARSETISFEPPRPVN